MTGSYTDVFGGSTVQPADVSYRAIALTADVTLVWPAAYIDTTDVVARINDVTATGGSWTITMPDATQVSVGQDALFANIGAASFSIVTSTGTAIATVAAGAVAYIYLTDNSTAAGSWRVTDFGATTGSANAAALAGQGLVAIANTLNQESDVTTIAASYPAGVGDRANTLVSTGGAITVSFTAASTLGNGWFVNIRNSGSGAMTLDPNAGELIDGASTKTINQGESCTVICSGSAFYTVGYGRAVASVFTRLVKSVAGSSNVTLTATEAANTVQEYTGVLTGNIAVIVPTSVGEYWVYNNTSGAFSLTVRTSAGTGIAVAQGSRTILYCDGTNVVQAQDTTGGTVVSVATGSGLTGGPITVSGTISLATTAVAAGSYGSTTSYPTFTVDAFGRLTTASSVPVGSSAALLTSVNVFTKRQTWSKGADLTSSSVLTLSNDGNYFDVTGTAAITSITTAGVGTWMKLHFDDALTLTYNATNLLLPGAKNLVTQAGDEYEFVEYAVGNWRCTGYALSRGISPIVQVVTTQTGAAATTTTQMFFDDTIPQKDEGEQFLTVSVTPKSATNKLQIDIDAQLGSTSGSAYVIAALFQDSTTGALAAAAVRNPAQNGSMRVPLSYTMDAGTTNSTTFRFRGGESAGGGNTAILNGSNITRIFGGVCISSIVVTEYTP